MKTIGRSDTIYFTHTICHVENKIKVEYAFQKIEDIPEGINIPETRVKPLGTAHAIYSTRNVINENFATINADDFYGRDAYIKAAEFLRNCEDNEYGVVAYKIGNTLTDNGTVKRGVIFENDGNLEKIVESVVYEKNGFAECEPLSGDEPFTTTLDGPVSMNLFCLTRNLIDYVVNDITNFFTDENNDLNTCEYLLPNVVFASSLKEEKSVKVVKTNSLYLGMTYREDLEVLKKGILKEIENGVYKNNLWG